MPSLTQDGSIWTIDLGSDENRFSPDWMDSLTAILDQVAASDEPAALVTQGAEKFYSNGLDLDWLGAHPEEFGAYVATVQDLFARMLTLPVPTVAAINGHAFGAGAMLAIAHDYRVMRTERGYFCFPEVDINIPFTDGMSRLIMCKVSPRTAVDTMTTGRRYSAEDACTAGLVDGSADIAKLAEVAASLVGDLAGKSRATLGAIKATMYTDVTRALSVPV